MSPARLRLAACVLGAVALLGGIPVGLAAPRHILGVAGWSVVVFGVLFGYGGVLRRYLRVELGFGEQLLAGAAVWIGLGGLLLVAGSASRTPLFVLAMLGVLLGLAELASIARRPPQPRVDDGENTRAAAIACGAALALFLVFNLIGMAGSRANPYDDQVSYVAFVKRLLDIGDLVEPFSFRRLSAFGGQTMLQALAALRGDVGAVDLLDRGIFQVIAILVVLDVARRRRLHLGLVVGVIAFLLSLWEMYLNSAAIWTGFACFVGAYGFASRDDMPPRASLVLTFATCAMACTLRQNYLAPAGLFAALVLVFHVRALASTSSWRSALAAERTTIVTAIATAAILVLPYMVAAFVSSGTFLYPIFPGTGNLAAPLRPTSGTWLDELVFFVQVVSSSEPIRIWWLLLPLMLLARDGRTRKPWVALLVSALLGFVVLVHSFMLSDSYNLWRYGFAYMTALAVVFAIEAAARLPFVTRSDDDDLPRLRISTIAATIAWLAFLVHFAQGRMWPAARFEDAVQNLEAARVLGTQKYDPRAPIVERMQAVIPADEKLAALIDDPYLLDFARNQIVCLDLVGFAAPAPGIPSFTTPAHWRAYLRSQGIRYVMFAKTGEATWLYRRGAWIFRMYSDDELFRYIGAHLIDAIDTLEALARESTVLFDEHGFTVIDLGATVPIEPDRGPDEIVRQDAYIRRFSEERLHSKAWQLTSRRDVVFRPDLTGPSYIVPSPGLESSVGGIVGLLFGGPEIPKRWISDRSHVRVLGDGGTYHLRTKVWISQQRLQTRPHVSLHVNGGLAATAQPDVDGFATLEADFACDGWCDVYITLSAISEWWLSAEGVRGAQMLEFEWTKR